MLRCVLSCVGRSSSTLCRTRPTNLTTLKNELGRISTPWMLQAHFATQTLAKYERSQSFAKLNDAHVAYFRQLLGQSGVLTEQEDIQPYNHDWMKKFHGNSACVLRPASTEQVSNIMAYCHKNNIAVVPQGGNTGLVGGSVPVFDEVVLSLGRMNKVLAFDEYSGIVTAEAGVVLENLNSYLEERGFIMPLDLGAKGSCQVGGNVSTNAGGLRYVRYGSLHGTVLGVEAVLADGRILDGLTTLRKDNTGYDLKQLFIGAEGTLGVVTKVSILAPRKPKSIHVAFVGVNSYEDVLKTMQLAREDLSEIVSAIELLDRDSMDLVVKHIPGARDPLSSPFPFYVLLETSGSNVAHDREKIDAFLASAMEKNLVLDGTLAQDSTQIKQLWTLRESIAESLSKEGAVYKYDISLPVKSMYDMVEKMRQRFKSLNIPVGGVVGYGHLGDGNLHLNIYSPKFDRQVLDAIEPFVFEETAKERGSVSAEHGLGLTKTPYIHLSKSPEMISLMKQIKQLVDPKGILNPYKVLPSK